MANELLSAPQDIITYNKTIGLGNSTQTVFDVVVNDLNIVPNSVTITTHLDGGVGDITVTDDGAGNLTGGALNSGSVDYITGKIHLDFTQPVTDKEPIRMAYQGNAINKVIRLYDSVDVRVKNLGKNDATCKLYYANEDLNWVDFLNGSPVVVVPQGEASLGFVGAKFIRVNIEGAEPYVMIYY